MARWKWFDCIRLTEAKKCFSFRCKTIIAIYILSNKHWSNADGISSYECLTGVSIMEDESKDAVQFVNEFLNTSKFFIKMQKYFTIGIRLKLEAILLFKLLEIVNFSIAYDRYVTFSKGLITSGWSVHDTKTLEAKNKIVWNFD